MKENRKFNTIRLIALMLITILMISSAAYAWIVGDVTPTITGEFQISSQTGITITVDGVNTSLISLNSGGDSTSTIELSEVSSADGENFFRRVISKYYTDDDGNEINTFVKRSSTDTTITDFVEVSMNVSLDLENSTSVYYLYFINNGYFEGNTTIYNTGFEFQNTVSGNLRALRCAMFMEQPAALKALTDSTERSDYYAENYPCFKDAATSGNMVSLFGNTAENSTDGYHTSAITALKSTSLKNSDGDNESAQIIDTVNNEVTVNAFDDYSINPKTDLLRGTSLPSDTGYICKLGSADTSFDLRLVIWLEGGSDFCNETYLPTDRLFNFLMHFVVFEKQAEA